MFFRNILIQLILIISLSVFISFSFLIPTLNAFWRTQSGHVEAIETYRSAGTIYLLAEQLNGTKPDKRSTLNKQSTFDKQVEKLAQLQTQFNYALMLKNRDQLSLSAEQTKTLAQGQTVFDLKQSALYHQLANPELILAIGDMDNAAPIHQTSQQDEMSAILNLIIQDLLTLPFSDWPTRMAQINNHFAVNVKMNTLNDNSLTESQRQELINKQLVFQYLEPSQPNDIPEYVFKKIPNHNTVIVIGPINSVIEESINNDILIRFFIIIAILIFFPLIIWLYPSWRTSAALLKATKNFGKGDLSSRSAIFKGSNLNGLATTFNKMANKVETLYENNIMLNSAVSHELRTPLTRIEFAIELLRDASPKQREKQIQRIEKAISEVRLMSDEMELYARFDQERPNFELLTTELTTWFDKASPDWIDDDKDIIIDFVHLSPQIHIAIEPFYFNRMIDNLIRNAYKHSLSNIKVQTEIHKNTCLITIENDGLSIEDKYKEKVFDPFFRLDQSRSRNSGGTGLGLAIVKQIVIWHHGKVWIEDSHSGGVKVKVALPLTPSC